MKVILLRDVAKIGRRFEIVEVPDGFALNKLIPAKDAEAATPANVKRVQQNKDRLNASKAETSAQILDTVNKLSQDKLQITAEANELGHLFQAVSGRDIANSAKERGFNLPDEIILISEPIKSIGEHQVLIKNQDQKLPLTINIASKTK